MGRHYLRYNQETSVHPSTTVKKGNHLVFNKTDNEDKILHKQKFNNKYKKLIIKHKHIKSDRIISLDSDLTLYPHSNIKKNLSESKPPELNINIPRKKSVIELDNYFTLSDKKNKSADVWLISEISETLSSKLKKSVVPQELVEKKHVDKVNKQVSIKQIPTEKQANTSTHQNQPTFILITKKIIPKQPVVPKQEPVNMMAPVPISLQKVFYKPIKPNHVDYLSNATPIQQKPKILQTQPIYLQQKPIVINSKLPVIKMKPLKRNNVTGQKCLSVQQRHITVQSNSIEQSKNVLNVIKKGCSEKNLLNVVKQENTNKIYPVALKSSDSNDFEYVTLLDNNPVNESETQILGI